VGRQVGDLNSDIDQKKSLIVERYNVFAILLIKPAMTLREGRERFGQTLS